jgi:hypothetical protein
MARDFCNTLYICYVDVVIEMLILVTASVKAARRVSHSCKRCDVSGWLPWSFLLTPHLITFVGHITELFVLVAGTKVDFRFSQRFSSYTGCGKLTTFSYGISYSKKEVSLPHPVFILLLGGLFILRMWTGILSCRRYIPPKVE